MLNNAILEYNPESNLYATVKEINLQRARCTGIAYTGDVVIHIDVPDWSDELIEKPTVVFVKRAYLPKGKHEDDLYKQLLREVQIFFKWKPDYDLRD